VTPFICYDLRFPEIFQIASKKSHLITVIANWPANRQKHWIDLIKARAIENQSYIAAVNRVGYGDNIYYSGDSIVVNPMGEIIIAGDDKERLLVAEINKNIVESTRDLFPVKNDRRENLYISKYKK
jgi:predicted amidohydrolase